MRFWRGALALVGASLAAGACGKAATPISPACVEVDGPLMAALARAPAAVALPDGSKLSDCIRDGTAEAELQSVGIAFHRAAEDLRVRAREDGGDAAAATQLGYLIGATRRGAQRTNGVMAELQRRVELVGGRLQDEAPARAPDVQRGLTAGERDG